MKSVTGLRALYVNASMRNCEDGLLLPDSSKPCSVHEVRCSKWFSNLFV